MTTWRDLKTLSKDRLVHYAYTLYGGRCLKRGTDTLPRSSATPVTCLWCIVDRVTWSRLCP